MTERVATVVPGSIQLSLTIDELLFGAACWRRLARHMAGTETASRLESLAKKIEDSLKREDQ